MKKLILAVLLSINVAQADIIDDMQIESFKCTAALMTPDMDSVCLEALLFVETNIPKARRESLLNVPTLEMLTDTSACFGIIKDVQVGSMLFFVAPTI